MSYILDALRRAESERGRGQVPGLHTPAAPVGLGEAGPPRGGRSAWMGIGGAALAVLLVLGVWWWSRPDPKQEVPADRPALALPAGAPPAGVPPAGDSAARPIVATPPVAAQTAPPAPALPPAPPTGPALLVAPAAPPAPPAPAVPMAAAAPVAPPPTSARDPAGPPAGAPRTATAAPARAEPAAPVGPSTAPLNKPILLADLPAAQRAELPQMLIGGAIYSDQATSRFVVINGLVVREGETAAPGVVLERIGPKSALIRWREMRIELPI